MSRTKKRAVVILSIMLALLAVEVGREYIVYRMASNKLEGGYLKLQGRAGLTKEEVRAIVGEPSHIEMSAADENWYWYVRESRGPVLKMVNSAGGYELNVQFDKTGRMLDVYSRVQ